MSFRAVTTQAAVLNEEKSRYTLKKELAEDNEEEIKDEEVPEVPVKRFSLTMLDGSKKD